MGYAQNLRGEIERRNQRSFGLADDPAFLASAALASYVSSTTGKALKLDEAKGFVFRAIDKYVPKPLREALKRDVESGLLEATGSPAAAAASLFAGELGKQQIPKKMELNMPFSPQKDNYCGANAVRAVLAFYGIHISEEDIGSKISRHLVFDGGTLPSSAVNFINSLSGATAVYYESADLSFIKKAIASGTPVIAINKEHTFVINGYDDEKKELEVQNYKGGSRETVPYTDFGTLGLVGCIVVVPRDFPEVKRELDTRNNGGFRITTLELVPKKPILAGGGSKRIALGTEYKKNIGFGKNEISLQASATGYNYFKGEKFGGYTLDQNLVFIDPSAKVSLDSRFGKFEFSYSGYHPYDYVLANTPRYRGESRYYETRKKWVSGEAKADYERFKPLLDKAEAMGQKGIDYETVLMLTNELYSGEAKYGTYSGDASEEELVRLAKAYYASIKHPVYDNENTFDFVIGKSKTYLGTLAHYMDPNTMPNLPSKLSARYDDVSFTWSHELLNTDVSFSAFGIAGTGGVRIGLSRWGAHAEWTKAGKGDSFSLTLNVAGVNALLNYNKRGDENTSVNISFRAGM